MDIIRRAQIPGVRTVEVAGKEHLLGLLQDFRKEARLREFLPRQSEVSFSWVRLEAGEVLEVHTHPVPSMIAITQGRGRTLGDLEEPIEEGDVVVVTTGDRHGFVGGEGGFWGISVQFEPRGLYEDLSDPWVTFVEGEAPAAQSADPVDELLERNRQHLETFATHRLFVLGKSGQLKQQEVRRKFLDCLQVWSNCFQRMVHARVAVTEARLFADVARLHCEAEIGHDNALARKRTDLRPVWDPVLEATTNWFTWKMLSLGDLERLVLVHLVVEAAGDAFYKQMGPYVTTPETEEHFAAHVAADQDHVQMAVDLLRRYEVRDVRPLVDIQRKGWAMMGTMLGRIVDLATA